MTVTCSDGTRRASFVELQLHEKSILAHNNGSKAHDHHDYPTLTLTRTLTVTLSRS